MNTYCSRMLIIVLMGGILVCKAMESTKAIKGYSNANVEQSITMILQDVIKNNKAVLKSQKLLQQDRNYVDKEIESCEMMVKIAAGIKYKIMEGIVPNSDGRIGYYHPQTMLEQTNELGIKLRDFVSEGKIDEELYKQHVFYIGQLAQVHYEAEKIRSMIECSNEQQYNYKRAKDHTDPCLIS
jgi:hypothetical protein